MLSARMFANSLVETFIASVFCFQFIKSSHSEVFLVITSQKFLQHIPDHSLFLRRKVKNESFSKIILQFSEAQRIHFWSFKLKKNYQRNWIRSSDVHLFEEKRVKQTSDWVSFARSNFGSANRTLFSYN